MSDEADEDVKTYEFDEAFQVKAVALMISDTNFARAAKDIIKPQFFENEALGSLAAVALKHVQDYKSAPGLKLLPMLLKDAIINKRIRSDLKEDVVDFVRVIQKADLSNAEYVGDQLAVFARRVAIEQAMLESIKALDKHDFSSIEKLMKGALAVGLIKDGGDYDYWEEIRTRTQMRHDIKAGKAIRRGITTGYTEMDARLYHGGWGRRELSIMMGAAKAGKSMSLGDFTKNAALAGFNTFYGSLEVSTAIISDRLDAALADTMMKDLCVDPDDIEAKIKALHARAGAIRMRDYPSGTLKPSQLHRVIEAYRADGLIFDLITIDYADIMAAEYRSDKLNDNLREIYIDLRAIAHEFDAALLSATQTNREGAKAMTAKATDVGDDFNKVRTADVLIGINASEAEKKVGEARLFWAASRNTRDGFSLRIQQDRSKMKFLTKILGEV